MRTSIICIGIIFIFACVAMTAGAQQAVSDIKGETQALQQQMLGNQEIMNLILSLQNDPDIQQVLQDPEIMRAVNSGDLNALMANPKFMRVMDKQAVRDIGTKLQK
ncbi:MAG TPA: hypothetical protein PLR60_08295 [Syntrophorhabdaceae bacterium]|nr:hypothetical protein [Syntrophorhabdaceae bacterium]